ncbi:MAG TPA: ATP-dependent DNA helicase [Patescibacteria group bacterium]|nr:ATP-dependent DNA helicase [Patescibacteria group bacterium]
MANSKGKKLNKKQQEAIKHGEGPLLIMAGAGTGKTTVITERIKWLVTSEKAKPAEILALTFTDKAAREMEERVDIAMPYGYTDMWIATFHSFCDRVLRQEALQIGLDPGYKLMAQAETTQFLINHLFKFKLEYFRPLGNPTKFVDGLLQHFSRLKDEDILPEEYLKHARKLKQKAKTKEAKDEATKTLELANAYRTYEELKIKEGMMDFADLISKTIKLFRTRKNILHQYQNKFKYFLVDEFQDTNYAQNELAMLLAGKKANLTVTGDDDQSIYRFRGAAVSNVIQFRKNYPKAKIVVLAKNYRSSQIILDHAYQLIQNNNPDRLEVKEKIDKKLKAVRKIKGKPIEFIQTDRVENEAEAVAKTIKSLIDGSVGSYDYQDIAILVRANNHAEPFVRALARQGLPYQFLGPGQLFRQAEVKDLIAYLKILYNFEDDLALYRVLSLDLFNLDARDLAAINNYAKRKNLSLFEACEQAERLRISKKTKNQIDEFVKMVYRHLKLLSKETAGQILYYFLEDTGLLKNLADYKSPTEEKQAQNISKFFDRLKTYEVDHEDASVRAVVNWLNLSMDLGESPLASNLDWTEENRVNLLTVHSAKGLEFPVVFLVNLVTARFPTRERPEQIPIPEALIKETLPIGDYHEQEERRLFYVGMTRACDRLFLTAANYYGEAKREKKISSFVTEALGEEIIKKPIKADDQLTIFDFRPTPEVKSERNRLPINYLSFSQVETYDKCPLQYRYRYIQRIPTPTPPAAGFGNVIHQTLKDFYQAALEDKKPTKKDLLNTLDKNWSDEGYTSKAHEKRMRKEAERMLRKFYDKGYNLDHLPKYLEQNFVIKAKEGLRIGGRIDRIDETKSGMEIIDYKTGKVIDQKELDRSLQMSVYALAAIDPGILRQNPEDVVLSFYFLDTGEKKSTQRSKEQLIQAKKDLIKKAKEIERSQFEPRPGVWCDFCEYKLICEAWS